jgi:hypothetical protein
MIKIKLIFANFFVIYFLFEVPVHAYLDPFSGSIILQFLAGLFAFILLYFRKLKNFLTKIISKISSKINGK